MMRPGPHPIQGREMSVKRWVITTDGSRGLAAISKELAKAGLREITTLDAIGAITGSADPQALVPMRAVRGVSDVSPDFEIDIGPPDADVQ